MSASSLFRLQKLLLTCLISSTLGSNLISRRLVVATLIEGSSSRSSFPLCSACFIKLIVPARFFTPRNNLQNGFSITASRFVPCPLPEECLTDHLAELIDKCVGSKIWVVMKGDKGIISFQLSSGILADVTRIQWHSPRFR